MVDISRTQSRHATRVSRTQIYGTSIPLTSTLVLLLAPNDADVLQTKLFLLLQTDEYVAALELAAAPEHGFQKAYALYRLNREVDAASVVKELKAADLNDDAARGIEHLEAQMVCQVANPVEFVCFLITYVDQQYRTGEYDHAVKTYTHLLDTCAPVRRRELTRRVVNMVYSKAMNRPICSPTYLPRRHI